ncbi:hypothetical protein ACGLHS_31715 [Variovorax sp. VaC1]|uniref:hypothetical protein n=1 Tax=Variovorax sp. VaC1 TaxID=3373132 RepID=UPI0037487E34
MTNDAKPSGLANDLMPFTSVELEATVTVLLRKNADLEARLSMERQHHESAETRVRFRQVELLTRVLRSHRIFLVHAGPPGDFKGAISQLEEQLREEGGAQIAEQVRHLADVVSDVARHRAPDDRAFRAASIEQLELHVIRNMALVGEELCRRADLVGNHLGEKFKLGAVARLFDDIEHSAQYALEGSSVSFRASVMMADIAHMVRLLRERANAGRWSYGALPSPGDLQSIYEECERRGGSLEGREVPEFSGWGPASIADGVEDPRPQQAPKLTILGIPLPKKLAEAIRLTEGRASLQKRP